MVRLVFRPYAQILRSICTSESLRASTRVSPGFTLFRHSSPSFGSQHICSHSDLSPEGSQPVSYAFLNRIITKVTLISQKSLKHSSTRIYVRLLGPCFKTGRRNLFYQYSAQQKDKASIFSQKLLTHVKLKNIIIR